MRTNKRASPKADAKKQTGNTAAVTASAEHNTGATKKNANGEQGPGATSTSDPDQGEGGTNKGASSLSVAENPPVTPSASSIAQPSLKVDRPVRSQADIHLPMLNALISPFSASEVAMLGPILKGDSTPAYVLSKGHWWIAAHGEVAMMNGEWKGTGHEVTELNKVETWQSAQGLSLVAGRDWLSGWSVGLGVGVARQRSRFLKRESEPGQTETVIDTTWTGSPQGIATNYTWDIVQTQIYEPGVEHDYSATNTYTKLRIAPEIGYRLLERNRLSLHARLSPVLLLDIGRKGNTLVWTNRSDSLENTTTGTRVMSLGDASLNERFPLAIALSGSVELRYRLCDRWSVSVLPRYTYWLPKADGAIPSLSMNGLGGAVRLRYDLRHNERRVK